MNIKNLLYSISLLLCISLQAQQRLQKKLHIDIPSRTEQAKQTFKAHIVSPPSYEEHVATQEQIAKQFLDAVEREDFRHIEIMLNNGKIDENSWIEGRYAIAIGYEKNKEIGDFIQYKCHHKRIQRAYTWEERSDNVSQGYEGILTLGLLGSAFILYLGCFRAICNK